MCQFKSVIILKDRVFVPAYEHHTAMLEELKIKDTRQNAEKLFVRAELIPVGGNIFSPIEDWRFNVDQDILPDWFVEECDKNRVIGAVKEWAESHIHNAKTDIVIKSGIHYLANSTVEAYGNSTVEAYGNSTVKAYDNSTIMIASYASNKRKNITLSEDSTLKDCKTKTIYQSGGWEFVPVDEQ